MIEEITSATWSLRSPCCIVSQRLQVIKEKGYWTVKLNSIDIRTFNNESDSLDLFYTLTEALDHAPLY